MRSQWTGERGKLHIWSEAIYMGAFYAIYTAVRNSQGSARNSHTQAFTNARRVIRWESGLGLGHERSVHHYFLGSRLLIQTLNTFYGTLHFLVTIAALVVVFRAAPNRYRRVRNALAITTGAALIGFAFFPLMPPRLLPTSFGYVDTLKVFGGPWSFDSGPMAKISNQYAAMPSLHIGWATWCVLAFWPHVRRARLRPLLILYPLLTLFVIVVTANHYVLDGVGGLLVCLVGWFGGRWLDRAAVLDRVVHRRAMSA